MHKKNFTTPALLLGLALTGSSLADTTAADQTIPPLRPPAVPLVAHDPYFSIWSQGDKLTDVDTTHWTGKPHRLKGTIGIDNSWYRVMGTSPESMAALEQKTMVVLPTRTIYTFAGAGVSLTLTFLTPALPEEIDVLSRPVTYLTFEVRATDGKKHRVRLSLEVLGELAVNSPDQDVVWLTEEHGDLAAIRIGAASQTILGKKGDDLRIDWGHLYLATPREHLSAQALVPPNIPMKFYQNGSKPDSGNDPRKQVPGVDVGAVMAFYLGEVGPQTVSRYVMLAYDDEFSIQYMKKNLRPYWRRNGDDATALLKKAARDYESLKKRCEKFDAELMADLRKAGGEKYARLAALAYRQCFAAGKFVADANGKPISFCKENHSNGCIGTSDVFYPMAPQFLLFGPSLAKSFLVPFMDYAASERWKFPFAPHDLGTYPHANGQVYGGGERTEENQMPVEESGNLLILMAAVAEMEGNAKFASLYWKQLEQWAEYLKAKGFDPENQLCTDDFAGHLAHNVNLSAKAIMGLGSFAKLCDLRGEKAKGAEYWKLAREFAQRWVQEADDGDHYRLAFDKPGTWSQKYNLMWDRILGLNLFPKEVVRKEMDFYLKMQNQYGLPLDNRSKYTKLDWITWTATLTQNRSDFEALIAPVYDFLNATPDRSPMTDWYWTHDAKKRGFTARPVVGGVFAQMLYDKAVWQKWARRDKTKASNWAPIPALPKVTSIIPAADKQAATWRYTFTKPADDWMMPGFDDALAPGSAGVPPAGSDASRQRDAGASGGWQEGKSGFGTRNTPGAIVGTVWNTRDIWLRREIELPAGKSSDPQAWLHHDEDAEIYINGVLALRTSGWTTSYDSFPLNAAGKAALKPGKNVIAVHCRQTGGGQYIDLGLVDVEIR